MRFSLAFIGLLIVTAPAAMAQCAGDDFMCWHRQQHNAPVEFFHPPVTSQSPGILDFLLNQNRKAEEHKLRMRILREVERQLKARDE